MKKLIASSILALLALSGANVAQAQVQAPASAAAPTASPRAADKLVAMCIGCHNIAGYQASFPEVHKVPMIAGQSAKYIVSALQQYRKGDRKHPTMKGIAASLSDQDMNDIAAYYEQLGKGQLPPVPETAPQAPADVQALLAKGACASCHGVNFNKPIDTYPKLAGQHSDYLYVALKAYQVEGNPHVGRSNAIMSAQAKPFSHAELKTLAKFIGSLPGELQTVQQSRFR
jgi:cytochrome c553